MAKSALLGQPPITPNDKLVHKALLLISPTSFTPAKQYPFGPPAPPHGPHDSRAGGMITGQVFAIVFAIVITMGRLAIRRQRKIFGLDDWAVIPAFLGLLAYLSLMITAETAGCLGKHIWDCTYYSIGWYVEASQLLFPLFYWIVFWAKISIVLQNRRITGISSAKWQIAHYTYLGFLVPLGIVCVCLNTFGCKPLAVHYTLQSAAELPSVASEKCLPSIKVSNWTRGIHIVTDWLLVPVPFIIIYRLRMPWTQRLRLMFVFSLGLTSSIASIVRNTQIYHDSLDSMYNLGPIYAWDLVDVFFATIVPSFPALNPVADVVAQYVSNLASKVSSKADSSGSSSHVKPDPNSPGQEKNVVNNSAGPHSPIRNHRRSLGSRHGFVHLQDGIELGDCQPLKDEESGIGHA